MARHVAEPREAQRDLLTQRLVVFVILIFLCVMIGSFAHRSWDYALLLLDPVRVEADVIAVDMVGGGYVRAHYRFTDRDGRLRRGSDLYRHTREEQPHAGETVPIVYAGYDPSLRHPEGRPHPKQISFYMLAGSVVVGLLSIGLLALSIVRLLRFQLESRRY
jgi:hypothetical protein